MNVLRQYGYRVDRGFFSEVVEPEQVIYFAIPITEVNLATISRKHRLVRMIGNRYFIDLILNDISMP